MKDLRKILCPVDTSSFSQRALRHGVALGKWYGAEVVALLVSPVRFPPALGFADPASVPPEPSDDPAIAAESLGAFIRSVADPGAVKPMVRSGQIAPEILRVADEWPADLIVMGTHGWGGFDRLLLGSVTEKVLRKARCPLLTVPRLAEGSTEPPEVTFATIVCGVDRSRASRSALEAALTLARESGGRLVLVHVLEDLSGEEPRFASHFNTEECWREIEPEIRASYEALVPGEVRVWCNVEVRTPRGKPSREILAVAEACQADVIVLGTAGWQMPFGATTQHVLRAAACPVLAVPAPATVTSGTAARGA